MIIIRIFFIDLLRFLYNNKDMEIKDLTNLKYLAKGRYGMYFQVSKIIGYKVLGKGFKTIFDMRQNSLWTQAVLEYSYYMMAKKSCITPKNIKLVTVYYNGKYYPGIKMSHIDGIPLTEVDNWKMGTLKGNTLTIPKGAKKKNLTDNKIKKYFQEMLRKKTGLIHHDLHTNNILMTKTGKLYIIDFSPDHINEQ